LGIDEKYVRGDLQREKLAIKADNDNEKKRENLSREEWNGSFCASLLLIFRKKIETSIAYPKLFDLL